MMRKQRSFSFWIATFLAVAAPLKAAEISSSVSFENLQPDEEHFFALGQLDAGLVALGMTTPIAGVPFDFDTPDTVVATFLEDAFGSGVPALITINDDSSADDNLVDESFGSLYRFEVPELGEYTVGVTGAPKFL